MNEIEIYQTTNGKASIEIKFDKDTFWLNQKQIADVFGTKTPAINKHIKNVFKDGELKSNSTISKMEIVQKEGRREILRTVDFYNLDMVISVGYRVNSQKATQFRIWATQRLKDYLVKGYALNTNRLQQVESKYKELQHAVGLISSVASKKILTKKESKGILNVLSQYSRALDLLDQYDHQKLPEIHATKGLGKKLSYDDTIKQINEWRKSQKAGKLFGNEKDQSFRSSISTIYQTFDGKELYPSLQEKAANLLYFIVKNHSFTDGNKRIAAGIFIYFLDLNKILFNEQKQKRIDDNSLVAITLLIAESKSDEKNQIVKLVANLIFVE